MCFTAFIGCEADTPNYNEYAHVLLFDSSHITFDSSTKLITISPVKAAIPLQRRQKTTLHNTAVIYTYAHGLVADSLQFNMRKTFYELRDTLYFHYDQVVDSLGTASPNPALFDQYKLDSIIVFLPATNPPKVETSAK